MGDLDFGDCGEVWIPKPIFRVENTDFTSESELVWNSSTILDGSYYRHIGDTYSLYRDLYTPDGIVDKFEWWIKVNGYKKEDIPEMKVKENRIDMTDNYRYAVGCFNYSDLLPEKILKSLSVMKSRLMIECMPAKVERIECKMSPMVKNNIISAYRKISMYGKKTPFIACFDDYGRRLPDEIKIDTMEGMDIKIVDPDVYGNNYLEFETIIPHHVCSENEEFVFKRDDSIF